MNGENREQHLYNVVSKVDHLLHQNLDDSDECTAQFIPHFNKAFYRWKVERAILLGDLSFPNSAKSMIKVHVLDTQYTYISSFKYPIVYVILGQAVLVRVARCHRQSYAICI